MKHTFLLAMLSAAMLTNATGTFSMIEINPAHGTEQFVWSDSSKHVYGAGELSNITELNGNIYFVAQDTFGNEELWTSNGTQQGTALVKDINPDGGAQIGNIMTVAGKLLFIASDNNNFDFDLFASDGTAQGTEKIADLNQGWNDGLSAQRAARFGNTVLFCTQTDLMSTDGTTGGTKSLLTLNSYSPSQGYCELNGFAYFILTNNFGKPQLWKTNGTANGTAMALDLGDTTNNIISVEKLLAFNGKLYLVASISGQGSDLFSFDGTGALTHIELVQGGNSYPQAVNVVNNQLVFYASNMTGTNLYKMSATDLTPQIISSASAVNVTSGLSFCNNAVYFLSDNAQQIHWVDLSNFSHHVLNLTNYSLQNSFFTTSDFLVGTGGKIFFAAYDTSTGKQVFVESNGTPEGTFSMMPASANVEHPFNILVGCGTIDVFDFKMWGNKVVVPANFNDAGRELWFYEPEGLVNAIEPVNNEPEIRLFPNPTSNRLFVHLQSNGYCETEMHITDINGQLVKAENLTGENTTVDVSSLAAGNYCASFISSATKTVTTKKFVVTK